MNHPHVVLFSGGRQSWGAAKRLRDRLGPDAPLTLLFTDTRSEDADLYRFLEEGAKALDGNLVRLADGRNIWEVFRDSRMIGNSRVDPCSRILKRELARRWIFANCQPATTTIYVGIALYEAHRFVRIRQRWHLDGGWHVEAPLIEDPFRPEELEAAMAACGLRRPRLYDLGFKTSNCSGGCVKAGQSQFAHLLKVLPEVYAEWERQEEGLRIEFGKDVAILRDRRGGTTKPLPLSTFRQWQQAGEACEKDESAACGCFTGDDDADDDVEAVA